MFTLHPQVCISDNTNVALVDVDIRELIRHLWRLDVTTLYSCQGDVRFADPTCWGNNAHLGYVMMKRDDASMNVIRHLMEIPLLKGRRKALLTFEFEQKKYGPTVTFRFPNQHMHYVVDHLSKI